MQVNVLILLFILIFDLYYTFGQEILPRNDKCAKSTCRQDEKCNAAMVTVQEKLEQQYLIVEKLQEKVKRLETKLKGKNGIEP